ncbi:transposase [Spirillospora sp. NPDC047279]|uniref:transposase n=1 Tax=Spirillospora sp. NPDC047279 TaxID=3155478 RepID=UPI0033FCAA91
MTPPPHADSPLLPGCCHGNGVRVVAGQRSGQHPDQPSQDVDPATLRVHRLAIEEGAVLYKRRAATVEPVNGHLKDRTALRRFARRGLTACQAELPFAAMVLNLGKLSRLAPAQRAAALAA